MQTEELKILHEDNHILVVLKPFNIPSQADSSGDKDMLTMVKEYIKVKYSKPGEVYVGLVHRLDRPTGGIMVFAKTSKAAARLSEDIRNGEWEKNYLAVVVGTPSEERAELVNYLKKNSLTNNVSIVPSATEGAQRAELSYKLLEKNVQVSLLDVDLGTGRGHQIRVQLSFIKCPVFGDVRYGGNIAKGYNLALFSYRLAIIHPVTKEKMVFIAYPPQESEPWKRFDIDRHLAIIK